MPAQLWLYPWLLQRFGGTEFPRHECWGVDGILLTQTAAHQWESALHPNGSRFILQRLPESYGCVSQARSWCAVKLLWECQGNVLVDTGANCPLGSLPDPGHGGNFCISCTGLVQWRGDFAPIETANIWQCCPSFLGPEPGLFTYLLRAEPLRVGSDCCCHLPNTFPNLTASLLVQGTCAWSNTFPLYLSHNVGTGNNTIWQSRKPVNDHPLQWDHIQLGCVPNANPAGYYITAQSFRVFEDLYTVVNGLATVQSCNPFLVELQAQVLCRDLTPGTVRVTISG